MEWCNEYLANLDIQNKRYDFLKQYKLQQINPLPNILK